VDGALLFSQSDLGASCIRDLGYMANKPTREQIAEEEEHGDASGSGDELDGFFESDSEGGGRDVGGGEDGQDDDNAEALAMFHRAWELANEKNRFITPGKRRVKRR
jgi:hypothetical protein